jgi:transcriptional regulator with XRE-family HTH domain
MTSTFGSRLRAQRERQQVALADIADRTKIRLSLLESLERDDVRAWPAGIFRRSYLRDYAAAIGLDPEDTVREFLALYPDPAEQSEEALAAAKAATGAEALSRKPRTRLQALFDSALDALDRRGRRREQPEPAPATAPAFSRAAHEPPPPFLPLEELNAPDAVAPVDLPLTGDPGDPDEAWIRDESPSPGEHEEPSTPQPPGLLMTLEPVDEDERVATKPANVQRSRRGITLPQRTDGTIDSDPQYAAHRRSGSRTTGVDLDGMALLCSRLARAGNHGEVMPLMADAARLLGAEGLILWLWDDGSGALWPSFNYGYRPELLSRMPDVRPESDNAIADAFRAGETRIVDGSLATTGAVVVPVITPAGCTGVLALEMRDGGERRESVHALATILAAQFAALAYIPPLAQTTSA